MPRHRGLGEERTSFTFFRNKRTQDRIPPPTRTGQRIKIEMQRRIGNETSALACERPLTRERVRLEWTRSTKLLRREKETRFRRDVIEERERIDERRER